MHKTIERYKRIEKKYPEVKEFMINKFFEEMEDIANEVLDDYECEKEYGCHIGTEELYNEAVDLLERVDKRSESEKWTVSEAVRLSNIDFASKDYTKYDYAYVLNMLFSDYCNIFTESSYYTKMAKNYLEDPDYCGEASERGYHNAKKRIKYNKEYEK